MANILQIIPAMPGWRALYTVRDDGMVRLITHPLVAWGLTEEETRDGTFRSIEGYDAGSGIVDSCHQQGGFVRYLEPEENPEAYRVEAEEELLRWERGREKRTKA